MDTALWRLLALREDHPAGTCWAWMEGPEKVCGRPADPAVLHLCRRHSGVAARRRDMAVAKAVARSIVAAQDAERRAPGRRAELAKVEARIRCLDRTATDDPASVNLPLSRRLPTDAQISELAGLVRRRDVLRRLLGVKP